MIRTIFGHALLVGALLAAQNAAAVPIQAYGGWLDATFQVFDYGTKEIDGVTYLYPNVVRREFVLGVDYFPAVPLGFTEAGLDYHACLQNTNPLITGCVENAWPPRVDFLGAPFPLSDGCGPNPNGFANKPATIVTRGNCSFAQKWANAENGGWGAVLVVNAPGDPVGGVGLGPGTPDFVTPLVRITSEVADEIRLGSALPDDPNSRGVPWINLEVTWSLTPPPQPVPEPSSLALVAIGAGLFASARKRR